MHQALERKGMSLRQLAEKTGISISTLKSYSSGRRPMRKASYEALEKIATALDVDIKDIVK
jgi:transcriptional regulator with XRE-family HTH domain